MFYRMYTGTGTIIVTQGRQHSCFNRTYILTRGRQRKQLRTAANDEHYAENWNKMTQERLGKVDEIEQ